MFCVFFLPGLSELLPYAKVMLGPLMDCHQQNVLVLGLGGAMVCFAGHGR